MTDFSFNNHVRPTVDQLCGLNLMLAYRESLFGVTDKQFCELLGIPLNEFIERGNTPDSYEIWDTGRVAQELNVTSEQVHILHAQGRIVGWADDDERGTVYPARQFVGGQLFNRIQQVVEILRTSGVEDRVSARHLFDLKYKLGLFSYAHLIDESAAHMRWVIGCLQQDVIDDSQGGKYLHEIAGEITADTVTSPSVINKWKTLHTGDMVVSKAGVTYGINRIERVAELGEALAVPFRTILAREYIAQPTGATIRGWVSAQEVYSDLNMTEEQVDELLCLTASDYTVKRVTANEAAIYWGGYFVRGADGKLHSVVPTVHRINEKLAKLKELRYQCPLPDFSHKKYYLGNVSMIDYALISPEHEEAMISLLERTITVTQERNNRKRKKKGM